MEAGPEPDGGTDPGVVTEVAVRPRDGVGIVLFFNCRPVDRAPADIFLRLLKDAHSL